ncbi:L,D-transpeptidase family protein [Solitalea sp. MAHUQ-68]|uniref:L,D-transpeptidase family protein n=1 Tax=Solitalea agri TaxID=2953739 RepID=A0A9X2JDK1_9SPHI|nr:L,D-transpeptidase family protein [Solitalea agri]MCO4293709.1 L,D-transpeptidase family protein [Solitalea agri]
MPLKKRLFIAFSLLLTGLLIYYFYPESKLPLKTNIDKLVVIKSERKLMAFSNNRLVKTYAISLGREPEGAKQYEGDMKTPEGLYFINDKNANSGYYKNLGISYPDKKDLALAKKLGKPAGGDVKIHGLKNGLGFIDKFQRWYNWTWGCIALTNKEIEELYSHVAVGTPIEIKP